MTDGDELPSQNGQFEKAEKSARIERELMAIEQSPAFVRSPVMKRLLRFIVNESRAGRGSQIKSYTLAVDGLGRSEDFDAQQDSYPRVQIGRLRKALEHYYQEREPVEGLRFELRPGGYEIHFVETGRRGIAPVAPMSQLSDGQWYRRLFSSVTQNAPLFLFLFLCLAVLTPLFAGDMVRPWGSTGDNAFGELEEYPLVSLQPVLADKAEGIDPDLADWLTSQMTGALVASRWVKVRPAGAGLGSQAEAADYELRNRMFRENGRLLLMLEMVDIQAGMTIWTRAMPLDLKADGSVANMDGTLTLLVSQVVEPGGAITTRMMQSDRAIHPRPGYSCLVYAAYFWSDRTRYSFDVADRCLKRTLALNPRFVPAIGALALLEYADNDFNYSGKGEGGARRAWDAISTAVVLDPENAMIRAMLAYVQYRRGNYSQACTAALAAYELNPHSSRLLYRLGSILFFTHDRALGLKLSAKALAADPNPGPWYYQTQFFDAMANSRTAEAARLTGLMSATTRQSGLYSHVTRSILFSMEGRYNGARESWRQVVAELPQAAADPHWMFDRLGVSKPYADQAIALLRKAHALE